MPVPAISVALVFLAAITLSLLLQVHYLTPVIAGNFWIESARPH